jgi:UDP-glucose 4-epimerase
VKILITGGAGFIGSHLAAYWHERADVVILDNLRTGHLSNLNGTRHRFVLGSILDDKILENAMQGVDYVFHLAALISVPESMLKPVECVEINTIGTLRVLAAAEKAGVKKLVFSSSAAVYGDNPIVPKHEDMLPEPKSPYAVTKLDGEYYCGMFQRENRLNTACLRYFNVFGPRQDPKSPYAAAVPIFIDKASKGEAITVFGDGSQTRDFIYVKDIVAANVFLAERAELSGVFNCAYGGSITINQLAEKIIHILGSNSQIEHLAERPGDVKHSKASPARLMTTGWTPQYTFESGMEESLHALFVR